MDINEKEKRRISYIRKQKNKDKSKDRAPKLPAKGRCKLNKNQFLNGEYDDNETEKYSE